MKASKADKKVTNVPVQVVLPEIETRYWLSFCTGLILVIALLSTCIFSNYGSPSSRSESAGFFSYLFSVIAPGALSLISLLAGGVVFVAVVAYLWSLLSAFVIVIGLILALTQMPVSRKKRR